MLNFSEMIVIALHLHLFLSGVNAVPSDFSEGTHLWKYPVISQQPPELIRFSNTRGSVLSCGAQDQTSSKITWHDMDGAQLENIEGLRTTLANGSLLYQTFEASMYRPAVHTGSIRCHVTNSYGSVVSSAVEISAVLNQPYQVALTEVTVMPGATAVIQCHVTPRSASSYVQVTSWRFGSLQITAGHKSDRVRTWREMLLLENVHSEDVSIPVRCQTMDTLTETAQLSNPVYIRVNENHPTTLEEVFSHFPTDVMVQEEEDIVLYCPLVSLHYPTIRWFRGSDTEEDRLISSSRVTIDTDSILIRRAYSIDTDSYRCVYDSTDTGLSFSHRYNVKVTAHVRVRISPERLYISENGEHTLTCLVQPKSMYFSIVWLRNGKRVGDKSTGRTTLTLSRRDPTASGVYQCQIAGHVATAYVLMKAWRPRITNSPQSRALHQGDAVTFTCTASGHPSPRIVWKFKNNPLPETDIKTQRLHVEARSIEYGEVSSQLIISPVLTRDAGKYTCSAKNDAGETHHSATLNIYGQAAALPRRSLTVAARSRTLLYCPVTGYPLKHFRWLRNAEKLNDHQIFSNGSLKAAEGSGLKSGEYSCEVTGGDGTRITGFVDVTVLEPPEIAPFTFPHALRTGQRTQGACSIISGHLPIEITWLKDNKTVAMATRINSNSVRVVRGEFFSNLIFNNLKEEHAGIYTCKAANSVATRQYSAKLSILVPPRWRGHMDDITALLGANITLNCSAYGNPLPTIEWKRLRPDGEDSTNPSVLSESKRVHIDRVTGSLTLLQVSDFDSGQYMCSASNGIGPAISNTVQISVKVPARFNIHRRNITVPVSGTVNMTCSPSGNQPIRIIWLRDNQPINAQSRLPEPISFQLTDKRPISERHTFGQVLTVMEVRRFHSGHYTCVARNDYGSDRMTWELLVTEAPDAPNRVSTSSMTSRSFMVTWSAPHDGHAAISYYVLQYLVRESRYHGYDRKTNNEATANWQLARNVTVSAHQRGLLISNLQPSTEYVIRIFAVNSHGPGLVSDVITASTLAEPPSAAPLNLKLKALSSTKILVSWNSPTQSDATDSIVGHKVSYQADASPTTRLERVVRRPEPSVVLRDLLTYTTYTVYVTAFNYAGSGPPSATASVTTLEDTPNEFVTGVTCSWSNSTSLVVRWKSLKKKGLRGRLIGYRVLCRKTTLAKGDGVLIVHEKQELLKLTSLSPTTNYTILVAALTNEGFGPYSEPIYCSTKAKVSAPPSRLKLLQVSTSSAMLSWQNNNPPTSTIYKFRVYQRNYSTEKQGMLAEVRDEHRPFCVLRVHSLTWGTRYEWWVTTVTPAGESEPSPTVTAIINHQPRAGIVSFSTELAALLGETVTLPCVSTQHLPPPVWRHEQATISDGHHLTRLQNGSLHVRHVTRAHSGNWSCAINSGESITVQLRVIGRPIVTSPQVVMATQSTLKITWKLVDDGNSPIQKYHVKYGVKDSGRWRSLVSLELTTELQLTDLLCGTVYSVIVTAENSLARGSDSQPLHAATRGNSPKPLNANTMFFSNSTCIIVRLYEWSSECDVIRFAVKLQSLDNSGALLRRPLSIFSPSIDLAELCQLTPSTWYHVDIVAESEAGNTKIGSNVATLSTSGKRVRSSPATESSNKWRVRTSKTLFILISLMCLICVLCVIFGIVKIRNRLKCRNDSDKDKTQECTYSGVCRSDGQISNSRLLSEHIYATGECKRYTSEDIQPYATLDLRKLKSADSYQKCRANTIDDCHYASVSAVPTIYSSQEDLSRCRTLQSGVSLQPFCSPNSTEDHHLQLASSVPPPPRRKPPISDYNNYEWRYEGDNGMVPHQSYLF